MAVQAICLASSQERRIVLVRRRDLWILPGGQPKKDETFRQTLDREMGEELPHASYEVEKPYDTFYGKTPYTNEALHCHVYLGSIFGSLDVGAEIEEARSFDAKEIMSINSSPVTREIVTRLQKDGRL